MKKTLPMRSLRHLAERGAVHLIDVPSSWVAQLIHVNAGG